MLSGQVKCDWDKTASESERLSSFVRGVLLLQQVVGELFTLAKKREERRGQKKRARGL
jgi:hypothetical protein